MRTKKQTPKSIRAISVLETTRKRRTKREVVIDSKPIRPLVKCKHCNNLTCVASGICAECAWKAEKEQRQIAIKSILDVAEKELNESIAAERGVTRS
jgi:hypothetical protein